MLINNVAPIESVRLIKEIATDDLTTMMQANFVAPFLLTKMILGKVCLAGSGRIVSIGSISVKCAGS